MQTLPQDDRVAQLLQMGEREDLDFKRVLKGVDSCVKTAIAMANTHGGWIILGIADLRQREGRDRVFGLDENAEGLGELQRLLRTRVVPPLMPPHLPSALKIEEIPCTLRDGTVGRIGLLHIPASNTVHSSSEGPTYIRVEGPQNRQLLANEVTELCLRRGVVSVIDQAMAVEPVLLETTWWREYAAQRHLSRPLVDAMGQLRLAIRDEAGIWRPTMAAVLLFAQFPGALLQTKAAIRIFHYRGHQIEHKPDTNLVRPPVTVDGPILNQIREATRLVLDEIGRGGGVQVTSSGFGVRRAYPHRVVQEAITNAVLHRDYRIPRDIHIRIFSNRIEVESPGGFPGSITPENIGRIGSRPRNLSLVNHLREFPTPPNLDAGEGVRMMIDTLSKEELFPPLYRLVSQIDGESVLVVLRNEVKNDDWKMVESYLREHAEINNADVRRILNLTEKQGTRGSKLLASWVEAGLLVVVNPQAGNRVRKYGLPRPLDSDQSELDWFFQSLRATTGLSIPTSLPKQKP